MTTTATASAVKAPPRFSWNLVPAALVALSAFLMFGLGRESLAYPVLAAGIVLGFVLDRDIDMTFSCQLDTGCQLDTVQLSWTAYSMEGGTDTRSACRAAPTVRAGGGS